MDMQVERIFSGAPWESQVSYCRAIKIGHHIYVSGTAPIDDAGKIVAPGDAYAQAKRCLEIIQTSLQALGAGCRHIVRTRMFVTDISRWAEFGKAHHEFFAEYPPVTSMLEVKSLIDPTMLIEIEADAIITD
ncbi:MAG: RidA family protein [Cyanobacteriota bacterium]